MHAKYSPQGIVSEHMKQLGLGYAFVAAVAGVCASSTLNQWLAGSGTLDGAKAEKIVATVRKLKRIADELSPVPCLFHDAGVWKQLLAVWTFDEDELARSEQAEQSEVVQSKSQSAIQ